MKNNYTQPKVYRKAGGHSNNSSPSASITRCPQFFMKTSINIYLFIVIALFSCDQKGTNHSEGRVRDSLLTEYIKLHDSLYINDNSFAVNYQSNQDFEILKATKSIDSSDFRVLMTEIQSIKDYLAHKEATPLEPNLKQLIIDEGYQFTYCESFNPVGYCFTITQSNDTYSIHLQRYKQQGPNMKYKPDLDYDEVLPKTVWDSVMQELDYADFWGLQSYEEQVGFDGDFLTVRGVVNNIQNTAVVKAHSVTRRFVKNTALYKAYQKLYSALDFN